MKERAFATLDVFTPNRFAGNPLAVVLDGDGLSDDAMRNIAREFNLSETVIVMAPRNRDERAFIRIFTPGAELPFAGHPTVGAAVLLGLQERRGAAGEMEFTLGEKVGPVPCRVRIDDAISGRATFTLPKLPQRLGEFNNPAALAAALGLEESDIGFDAHRAALFSAGVPFPLIPVKTRDAVDRARLSADDFARAAAGPGDDHVFIYCREPTNAAHHYYARMFAPGFGIPEDPATGSAAAAFSGAIMAFDKPREGEHRFVIEQGYAMGRPSEIELTLHVEGGVLRRATIGGGAVIVTKGVLLA